MSTFDDDLMAQGIEYNVGTNGGFLFKEAIFTGKKMHNGKEMLCFKLHNTEKRLIINPSYMAFALEYEGNVNDIINAQATEAWEGDKADGKTNNETSRRDA